LNAARIQSTAKRVFELEAKMGLGASTQGEQNVASLVQRLAVLAAAVTLFPAQVSDAPHDADRPALRISLAARWALWVFLLILPGSFLLLPVLLWGKIPPQRQG
jgi:hypothetical protein